MGTSLLRSVMVLAAMGMAACAPGMSSVTDASGDGAVGGDGGGGHDAAASDTATGSDAATGDDAASGDDGATGDDGGSGSDGGALQSVTFEYRPGWRGATAVTVVGGFGQSGDWMTPFATLTDDGHGVFRGTAMLPPGTYPYVFRVVGDAAAAMPATYARYAIDPAAPDVVVCPMASPTYSTEMNPCSVLHVPATGPTPAQTHRVRGTVVANGHAVAGWLVEIERLEMGQHHFFANRVTTGADGTFELPVATGSWRIQALHPTYLNTGDAGRDPTMLAAARRVLSSAEQVTADVDWGTVETAYNDYARLAPVGAASVPVHFTWSVISGARMARMAIYGGGMEIGDPWHATPYATTTSAVWDGTFETSHAREMMARSGESYWWGTWQQMPTNSAGVVWTQESMVVPLRIM